MARGKAKTRKPKEIPVSDKLSNTELLQALETLARALQFDVRYEKGDFRGGTCRVHDDSLIVIRKTDPPDKQIRLLALELGRIDLKTVYVMPEVREVIERIQSDQHENAESQPE
jgi:hypothetical protein